MRDPRLDWNNIEVIRHQAQKAQELREYSESFASLDSVRSVLVGWWRDRASAPTSSEAADATWRVREAALLGEKLARVADGALGPIVDAISRVLMNGRDEGISHRLARHLVAHAVGAGTAESTASLEQLLRSTDFAHECAHEWDSFRDGFVDGCRGSPARLAAWVDALRQVPADAGAYIDSLYSDERVADALREEEATWRATPPPPFSWHATGGDIRLADRAYVPLDFLLALDLGEWLGALENVPSMTLVRELVAWSDIVDDRDRLVEAIRTAANTFDGERPTGSRVLLACVEALAWHAERLERAVATAARSRVATSPPADAELKRLREQELPSSFRLGFDALLGRNDGRRVAIEYAAALAGRADDVDPGAERWAAPMVALRALAQALEASGVRLDDVRRVMAAAQRSAEMSFFLVGVAVELKPSDTDPDWAMRDDEVRRVAWDWYGDLLAGSDSDLVSQVNPYRSLRWPFLLTGCVLAGFADPVEEWRRTWASLFSDRHRARFRFSTDSLDPSLHIVRTGIGLLEVMIGAREPGAPLDARSQALWRELFHALEFLVAGQDGRLMQLGPRELARLFAYVPYVFGATWASVLSEVSEHLRVDEVLALRAARHLVRNGVERDDLHAAFAQLGLDIQAVGRAALVAAEVAPEVESGEVKEALGEVLNGTSV